MKKSTELVITAKGLFSTDMRGKPMTAEGYYKRISEINSVATDLFDVASVGFYKVGQLLNRAKKELKGDFGKLKKELADDGGIHEKQQERYMAIARNKNIELNYSKLPPQWTFWEKLSSLTDAQFNAIQHLISKDAKWKELAIELGKPLPKSTATGYFSNVKDNRSEIFGLEYDYLRGTKKHKEEFNQLEKDVSALAQKYSFIKLKKKNYFVEVKDMLNEEKVKDDTSSENAPKFDKQYQSQKKIDI
jgi:hypothetical protein